MRLSGVAPLVLIGLELFLGANAVVGAVWAVPGPRCERSKTVPEGVSVSARPSAGRSPAGLLSLAIIARS